MREDPTTSSQCPYCKSELEVGCVLGHMGLNGSFRWFPGEPTVFKNMVGGFSVNSEELGSFGLLKGPYMLGARCKNCRKVFLSY